MNAVDNPGTTWAHDNIGSGGYTAEYVADSIITTALAGEPRNHIVVLFNLGVNSFGTAIEADWIADVETIVDAVHARWPQASVYLARPWKQGYDAVADDYADWIDTIVAARTFCYVGHDERVWLKGGDNGATMTYDGIHYSSAGQAECAAQWATVLGY